MDFKVRRNHSAVLNLVNLPNEVLTIVCRDLAYWEIGHPNYPEHQASSKDAVEFSAACKVIRHVFQNLCEEISVTVHRGDAPFKFRRQHPSTRLGLPRNLMQLMFPSVSFFNKMEERLFAQLHERKIASLVGRFFVGPSPLEQMWAASASRPYALPQDTLCLNFRNFDDEMIACIASALVLRNAPCTSSLKHLALRGNMCGPHAVAAICAALVTGACPKLETIDFAHNADFGDGGVIFLAGILGSPHCKCVTKVDVERTRLSADGVAALVDACAALPALRSLKIGGNAADTSAAQCLNFLSCGPSRGKHQLLELSMHSLHLGDDGARSLVAGFEAGCLHSIQAFDLSHNDITCHGCEMLADAIEKYSMPNIQELLLTGNQIGDHGVSALARVLTSKKHRSMTNLLVNDVGLRRGALPLMQAMLSQSDEETGAQEDMIWLDLSENGLCHEAAVELARWLNDPTTKLRWHFQCALNTNLFEDEDVLLIANAFYGCVHRHRPEFFAVVPGRNPCTGLSFHGTKNMSAKCGEKLHVMFSDPAEMRVRCFE